MEYIEQKNKQSEIIVSQTAENLFTAEERVIIGKVAKSIRPSILNKSELLMNIKVEDRLLLFINAYNYIKSLIVLVEIREIKDKLNTLVGGLDGKYKLALFCYRDLNSNIKYGIESIYYTVESQIFDDFNKIQTLIITASELGKKVIEFDPDQFAGVEEF